MDIKYPFRDISRNVFSILEMRRKSKQERVERKEIEIFALSSSPAVI